MPDPQQPIILVTNDDGIDSPGLRILAQHLHPLGEVWISAPSREQSAVGHGISLNRPLRLEVRGPRSFAVSGTPADAVILALHELCPRRPSLVISGINHGLNLGTDVFYSGTVAGALEGVIRGVQAIAVSQDLPALNADAIEGASKGRPSGELEARLDNTARFAAQVAGQLLRRPLAPGRALNINAPGVSTRRFVWTRLGNRIYRERVDKRVDLRGVPYYWIGGPPLENSSPPGTDSHVVEGGRISITPLGLDLTSVESPAPAWLHVEGFTREEEASRP